MQISQRIQRATGDLARAENDLRDALKSPPVSLRQIAIEADLSPPNITEWLKGRRNLSPALQLRIALAIEKFSQNPTSTP